MGLKWAKGAEYFIMCKAIVLTSLCMQADGAVWWFVRSGQLRPQDFAYGEVATAGTILDENTNVAGISLIESAFKSCTPTFSALNLRAKISGIPTSARSVHPHNKRKYSPGQL